MTQQKRVMPYERLMNEFRAFVNGCMSRDRRTMWTYPKAKVADNTGYGLRELYERVAAAEQCGFDVQLKATDEGLQVVYLKNLPQRPYSV